MAGAAQQDYIIGPQDVLAITVWDQADLAGKFGVETDGTFTFPLIGRVKAGGLTLRELEAALKRRLADGFFVNPQVTLSIEQYRSQRVFVVGEVRSPGPQSLTGDMTLIEVLALAGSTLPSAGDEAIIVRPPPAGTASAPFPPYLIARGGSSDPPGTNGRSAEAVIAQAHASQAEVIRIDIRDLQGGVLTQNVRLQDGDQIFVPRAPTVFVYGQVRNPGEYPVKSEVTIRQILALAGGITDRGSTGRIKIVRQVDGKEREIDARLNDGVLPGDTITVGERFF